MTAAAYMAVCYAFIFIPVGVLVLFSFQSGDLPVPPLHGLSLRWYASAFNDGRLVDAFANSIVVGSVSSGLSVMIGFLAAFGLARYDIPGKAVMRAVIMLPLAVSYLLVGMGLLVSSSALGLGPSLVTVIIGHVPGTAWRAPAPDRIGRARSRCWHVSSRIRDHRANDRTGAGRRLLPLLHPLLG
jgi:spermidine/putrescine transport system permease protein